MGAAPYGLRPAWEAFWACPWSAAAERSADAALDSPALATTGATMATDSSKAVWRYRFPPQSMERSADAALDSAALAKPEEPSTANLANLVKKPIAFR